MSRASTRKGWGILAIAVLIAATGIGLGLGQHAVVGQDRPTEQTQTATGGLTPSTKTPTDLKNDPTVQHANSLSHAFREAASVAMPSVVRIESHSAAKKVSGTRGGMRIQPFGHGDNPFKGTPFEEMIPPGFGGLGGQPGMTPERDGVGSGVIIDPSGIVLTNNHVVEGADTVTIYLHDGREFKASDIKTDPQSDLAVLRIHADKDLPSAHLGDSEQAEIGDWVIAIGSPFNLEATVSAGIISGKGRELGSIRRSQFLQTDAAINPGNSGGPLVNLTGEVVGINTAIASNSGGYQGIGFAIPINHAKWVTEQLVHTGSVKRGYLGVAIGELTNDLAEKFGVAKGEGVLVNEVLPNTPAAAAKMQEGDVIVKFAGKAVHNPREVQSLVERSPLDSTQSVELVRDGSHKTISITVKPLPSNFGEKEEQAEEGSDEKRSAGYAADDLGLEVADMSADEAQTYSGNEGVVIRDVESGGIAAEAGLRPGMLIRKVGKTTVHNVQEFEDAVKHESIKDGVLLHVRTQAGNRFVVLQAK